MLSCTTALHIDYLHLLALSWFHLDSYLSHFSTMSSTKSTLQSLSLCDVTYPFTCGKNIPLSVLDQFRYLALSIGKLPSQELEHLFFRHSFFPLYYIILLFLFKLHIKEKGKKIVYSLDFMVARFSCVSLEQCTLLALRMYLKPEKRQFPGNHRPSFRSGI